MFYPLFERSFALFVTIIRRIVVTENLGEFLIETLDLHDKKGLSDFGKKLIKNVLKSFGRFRYLQLIHNFSTGPLYEMYLEVSQLTHELDFIAIQISSLFIDSSEYFQVLAEGFFDYDKEISSFLIDGTSLNDNEDILKQEIIVLDDFFLMIDSLMKDELCQLSVEVIKEKETFSQDNSFIIHRSKVMRNVLLNIMASFYWTDLETIKENLRDLMKDFEGLDELIYSLSDIDAAAKKIRLKDEYLKEFDPYLFYKVRVFQRDVNEDFASKYREKKVDLISGKYEARSSAQHLYNIQQKVFSSSLLSILKNLLINWNETHMKLLGTILRLLYVSLEYIKNNDNTNDESQTINGYLNQAFDNQTFLKTLEDFLNTKDKEDYHQCIRKILERAMES